MNTCKTCKHWVPFDEVGYRGGYDPDERRLGLCRMASDDEHRDDSLAVAVDASDYVHDLRTAENFGCVQWAAKP